MAPASLSVPKQRHTASIKQLLGKTYKENPRFDPPLPQPLQNVTEYDDNHVRTTLGYVDERIRSGRKITPPNEPYIILARDHAVKFLTTTDAKAKKDAAGIIQLFETFLHQYITLQGVRTINEANWQQTILGIRRLQLYTRYGDYMAHYLKDFKAGAKEDKSEGWETFQKDRYVWTTMAKELQREEQDWIQYGATPKPTIPTKLVENHFAVSDACKVLALDFDEVCAIIKGYAERNELAHSPLETLIKERKWADLASTFRKDLDDLRRVVPTGTEWLQAPLAACLRHHIGKMFKCEEKDFDQNNPQTWLPSDYLRELANRYHDTHSGETAVEREDRLKTVIREEYKKALNSYRQKARQVENLRQIRKVASFHYENTPTSTPKKRKASTEHSNDAEKRKRQKRKLEEAIELSTKAVSAFDEANTMGVIDDDQIEEILELCAELSETEKQASSDEEMMGFLFRD